MFNWLKKSLPMAEKAMPKIYPDAPCEALLTGRDLLDKCAAYKKQGNEFLAKGLLEEAAECYRQSIAINPDYADGYLNLGFVLKAQNNNEEAAQNLQRALSINPKLEDAYFILGGIAQERNDLAGAIENYKKIIEINPGFELVYHDLYNVLIQSGQVQYARKVIEQAISINPDSAEFNFYMGNLHTQEKDLVQAIAYYQKALSIRPEYTDALRELGNAFKDQGNLEGAQTYYDKALAINPDEAVTHNNMGALFQERGDLDKAEASYRKALALIPDFFEAYNNLGSVLNTQGRLDEALAAFNQAHLMNPGSAEVHNNLGTILRNQNKYAEAEAAYRQAIKLNPELCDVCNNLGVVLVAQKRRGEAIEAFRHALKIKPDFSAAHYNLGVQFQEGGELGKAVDCYKQVLYWEPDVHDIKVNLLYVLLHLHDWKDLQMLSDDGRRVLREQATIDSINIPPFSFLASPESTLAEQKLCASNWAQRIVKSMRPWQEKTVFQFERATKRKINLGYFSADFRNHAVAHLMAQIFELHDRDRFHLIAYSFGPKDDGEMRKRLQKSFDTFVDLSGMSDVDAATKIHGDKIDVLVNLTGYTQHERSEILALRPAPIQVNYLGFPGTMGADFMDYLIADRFIIPPEFKQHYAEKVLWLPDCYMPRDTTVQRQAAPGRKECGLPEDGFVFCSFNMPYKITPDMFDVWCRLLQAVPGSVLWLPSVRPEAESNLNREAKSRGVAPERIIRARRADLVEDHLARLQCADLFLDTTPYNAHTTCSDALWMGLPVITCVGETFPSRVAGSLLTAIGAPELIANNLEEYYELALDLATHKEKYEEIRNKIRQNRESAPLFDSTRFTRNLEKIYQQMWDEYVDASHVD